VYMPASAVPQAQQMSVSGSCCMLFAPRYQHLVMSVDLSHLEPSARAWRLQDGDMQHIWRSLSEVEYSALHTTPALLLVSFRAQHVRSATPACVALRRSPCMNA
jgi:hypothetical protein